MGHAYTPGLKVTDDTIIVKERKLPLKGEILVEKGKRVGALDIVARTFLPGNIESLNIANKFSLPPSDVQDVLMVEEGDEVEQDQIIAANKGLFGLFKTELPAPVKGTVESISTITGQLMLREPPHPVQINAYINGTVARIIPEEGVVIETRGMFIQGIFGVGGEAHGEIHMVVESPDQTLTPELITPDCKDKIVIGGDWVSNAVLEKAIEVDAVGVVAGGFDDSDLKDFLGYDLGVAITGHEDKGITLIITEGFGKMRMAHGTFDLLKSAEGRIASINGATQIRAGVIRPELIVPHAEGVKRTEKAERKEAGELVKGTPIRCIREPYFGLLGKVTELPVELTQLESETKVRILKAELEDGREVILPRANVELIES
ncbi:hypothetical protein KAU45_00430 [bacterium]|nr:hypothetical protein [bacterium]